MSSSCQDPINTERFVAFFEAKMLIQEAFWSREDWEHRSFLQIFPQIQWQFSHSENSAKTTGVTTIGPVVRNHISSKKAERSIAIRRTT